MASAEAQACIRSEGFVPIGDPNLGCKGKVPGKRAFPEADDVFVSRDNFERIFYDSLMSISMLLHIVPFTTGS